MRYFRHPFLDVGRDLQTRRELEAFLTARGYRIAPVTLAACPTLTSANMATVRSYSWLSRAEKLRTAAPNCHRKCKNSVRPSRLPWPTLPLRPSCDLAGNWLSLVCFV